MSRAGQPLPADRPSAPPPPDPGPSPGPATGSGKPLPLPPRSRGELNPVLLRELRARFRGPRAFNVLTTFLVFSAGLAWAVHTRVSAGPPEIGADAPLALGPTIFGAVLLAELITVLLVAPGLTMAAISGEIERRTYELLLATPLSAGRILRGKLGAAMAYLLLLAVSALPVASLAFVLGGVSPWDLLRAQAAVLVGGLLLASLGLAASAFLGRTERAAIAAYLGAAGLSLGPLLALWLLGLVALPSRLLRQLLAGTLAGLSPLVSTYAAGQAGIRGVLFGAGTPVGAASGAYLAQALSLQLLLATGLCLMTARQIRPGSVGRRPVAILVGLALAWLLWLQAMPIDWLALLGSGA